MSSSYPRLILRRGLQSIPLIFGVILLVFILIHLAPGDPAQYLIPQEGVVSPEYVQAVRTSLGLDKPLYIQFLLYLYGVLRGDFGVSLLTGESVIGMIADKTVATLILLVPQWVLAFFLSLFLAVNASKKPYSASDNLLSFFSLVGYSVPDFWVGILLMTFFAVRLGWFPVSGMSSILIENVGIDYVLDVFYHLALPSLTLLITNLALFFRLTRASMLDVLKLDFIVTARAKGCDERTVLYKHGLRNALLPVVTVLGWYLSYVLVGVLLVEVVFAWPGLGRLAYESILRKDYPVLLGLLFLVSVMVIVINLITDIAYCFLDPRIRYK